jgi:hypothetical protein
MTIGALLTPTAIAAASTKTVAQAAAATDCLGRLDSVKPGRLPYRRQLFKQYLRFSQVLILPFMRTSTPLMTQN